MSIARRTLSSCTNQRRVVPSGALDGSPNLWDFLFDSMSPPCVLFLLLFALFLLERIMKINRLIRSCRRLSSQDTMVDSFLCFLFRLPLSSLVSHSPSAVGSTVYNVVPSRHSNFRGWRIQRNDGWTRIKGTFVVQSAFGFSIQPSFPDIFEYFKDQFFHSPLDGRINASGNLISRFIVGNNVRQPRETRSTQENIRFYLHPNYTWMGERYVVMYGIRNDTSELELKMNENTFSLWIGRENSE